MPITTGAVGAGLVAGALVVCTLYLLRLILLSWHWHAHVQSPVLIGIAVLLPVREWSAWLPEMDGLLATQTGPRRRALLSNMTMAAPKVIASTWWALCGDRGEDLRHCLGMLVLTSLERQLVSVCAALRLVPYILPRDTLECRQHARVLRHTGFLARLVRMLFDGRRSRSVAALAETIVQRHRGLREERRAPQRRRSYEAALLMEIIQHLLELIAELEHLRGQRLVHRE
ncbi:hypothetical protein GCM10010174_88660 [Kutzneria viridogrisea]|uniref:hypothetical protein n=1 Tax=Kutzneria viridogrisea TaxID=47990 RepID=UPI001603758E